jgi:phosphoglycolate phosphatase
LAGYFAEVHGGDTSPCLKPDPCAINGIIAKYNIPKDRVLFIGDMTVDIETGKNANVRTCAVAYGFDDKEKLKGLNPDLLIDDLMELKDLIE